MSSVGSELFPHRFTTWRDDELRTSFSNLHNKILSLTSRIEKIRNMPIGSGSGGSGHATRCTMVCAQLEGEDRFKCMRECSSAPLGTRSVEGYTEYKRRFPVDVHVLDRNSQLRRVFERAQVSTQFNDDDAELLGTILAMPIATEAIPDESWHHALVVLKRDEHRQHLHHLCYSWVQRRQDYIDSSSADALMDKIRRHDSEGIIVKAVNRVPR